MNAVDRHYMKNSPLRYIRKRSAQKFGLEAIRTLVFIMRTTTSTDLKIKAATIVLENARHYAKLNKTMMREEKMIKLVRDYKAPPF